MRILFLSHNIAWRGGFLRAYHWGRHLARRGHDVTVMAISESTRTVFESSVRDGVSIVKSPDLLWGRLRSGWDPWDTMRRLGYLWNAKYDLVHSVDSRPVAALPALALKYKQGTKLVMDWGDWWGRGGTITERRGNALDRVFAPVETYFEEAFRTYADGTVVLSAALEQRAVALGVRRDRVVRIPHGADVEGIKPLDKEGARRAVGLPADTPIIGYVGLLFERDADLLTKTFSVISSRNPRVVLCIIGNSNMRVPDEWLASGRVIVTGPITYERLKNYIAACDVMLLPLKDSLANRGRFPSKVSDYLASGRPVVATRVGDVSSLIEAGGCGAIAGDTPEEFAAQVLALLESGDLPRLGVNARRTAEQHLDWRLLTDDLERFYHQVLADS